RLRRPGGHRRGAAGHRRPQGSACRGHDVTALLSLPIALPLIGAGISVIAGRSRTVQRAVALSVLTANLGLAVVLLVQVDRDGPVATAAACSTAPHGQPLA